MIIESYAESNESLKITRLRNPIVCSGLFLEQAQANTFKTLCICQKPSMDKLETAVWSFFCVYMSYNDIYGRKLQNVVYMKKNYAKKKE